MPTRTWFELVADLINEYVPECRRGEAATEIAAAVEQHGCKFNRERFLTRATQISLLEAAVWQVR